MKRVAGALRAASQVSAGPLLVRAAGFGAGAAALVLSLPVPLRIPQSTVLAVLLALLSAIGPGTALVSLVEYLAVVVWSGTTLLSGYQIGPGQVLGLAAALYLHHTACALAAVLPVDATVDPRVLLGWLRRTGAVLLVSGALGLAVLALPSWLGRSGAWYLPLLGLAALLAAGFGLVRLARGPR